MRSFLVRMTPVDPNTFHISVREDHGPFLLGFVFFVLAAGLVRTFDFAWQEAFLGGAVVMFACAVAWHFIVEWIKDFIGRLDR